VTISSTAAGSPLSIPVALSIGEVWTAPMVEWRLLLPIVRK
jgi:hypothetical protein